MICPNCGNKLAKLEYDHQQVFHCANCGGTFFNENGINRISVNSAKILAAQHNEIASSHAPRNDKMTKSCPRDGSPLYVIQNNPAVPQNATIWECMSCYGTFALPDDLVQFKKAQDIKLQFFKIWGMPLPSLQSVMILGSFMVMMLALFTTYWTVNRPRTTTTQAEDIIQNLSITRSERYVFVYFKTSQAYRSRIVLEDRTTGVTTIKQLQETPAEIHSLTTGDISTEDEIYYSIILTDKNGDEVRTGMKRLSI